jgi:hypothetical protein
VGVAAPGVDESGGRPGATFDPGVPTRPVASVGDGDIAFGSVVVPEPLEVAPGDGATLVPGPGG